MLRSCLLFYGLILQICCFSQTGNTSSKATLLFPSSEKIHLHTDKETYFTGETIWFKAYLLAEGLPSSLSTTLFVDLLYGEGTILQQKIMPVINGTADGYFTLPDTLGKDNYFIRAYTSAMIRTDSTFSYIKRIRTSYTDTLRSISQPEQVVSFFPEGGNLITGLHNHIAFKATYTNGYPFSFSGLIKNDKGETVDSILSEHDGMGVFQLMPAANETYFVYWKDNNNKDRRTALPAAQSSGITMHTEQLDKRLFLMLQSSSQREVPADLEITGVFNNMQIFRVQANMGKQHMFTARIPLDSIPAGLLTITVFNKMNQPLAEKLVFVDNPGYQFNSKLTITRKGTCKREKNSIEIVTADTTVTNYSLAVYDANLQQPETNGTIYSDLLFANDIRGYVYNAGWYFEDTTSIRKKYLDYVLLTNGWRRYNWELLTADNTHPSATTNESYLSLRGKLVNSDQKALSNEAISLVIETKDSARQWFLLNTDNTGMFVQKDLIFYDSASIYYKVNNKNVKNAMISLVPGNGLIKPNTGRERLFNPYPLPELKQSSPYIEKLQATIKNQNPLFEQKGKTLGTVIVKSKNSRYAWHNDPLTRMDEKYATMFRSSSSDWAFDVLNDPKAANTNDIYDYLFGKVPGLVVKNKGFRKYFSDELHGGVVKDYFGAGKGSPPEPLYYINEHEVPDESLDNLNVDDIAYIKYYDRFSIREGLPPALCIYLKKQDDRKLDARKLPGNLSKIKIAGYSPVKEFYSPDYAVPVNLSNNRPDLRTTLYWQPYIITDKTSRIATIVFYNNDISQKLKVVLEGMNEEGKLVHMEEIIE